MESNLQFVFKCPTCGSTEGEIIGDTIKCRSCSNQYKREHINDKVFAELHSAYELRLDTEFSKAQARYDQIIDDCRKNPSKDNDAVLEYAYYGKYLCDQRVIFYTTEGNQTIPSFWEINPETPEKSANFQKALEYAKKGNSFNIDNYQEKAKLIEDYKRKYEDTEKREKNCDVFICFKSNDESVKLGNELYDYLQNHEYHKNQSLNVFFSPKSLRDKGGQDYEPIIHRALRTAKVMLVLCSSEDDLNSVWVRNEWWRFSHFAKGNKEKIIIPILMKGFKKEFLPDEIRLDRDGFERQCVIVGENDHALVSRVRDSIDKHMKTLAASGVIRNSFDYELNEVRSVWNEGKKSEARQKIDTLIQDKDKLDGEDIEAYINAYMLKFRIFSDNYHDFDDVAEKALSAAQNKAKEQGFQSTLKKNKDYRDYCAVKRKKTVVKTLAGVLVAIAVAAGGFGVYQFMQDPVVDAYVTGKPASVQVEYGEGVLSGISTITTVSKKGHEKEVELTNSMVSGFDPTKIGVQEIVISYGEIEIHLSVNVVKYTLSTPTGLRFDNGQITWDAVQKAESYTLKINDDVIENVKATSYQGYAFEQTGVYSIQVKASADQDFGMDSAYTKSMEVVCLAQASNLKREGMKLSWDAVSGCSGYDVYINGEKAANVGTTAYTMTFDSMADGDNRIYVVPTNGKNMKLKDELTGAEATDYEHNGELTVGVVRLAQVSNLKRDGLELSWDAVSGCTGYEIYVNDEKIADCEDNGCTLTSEMLVWGENRLSILPMGAQNIKLREDLSDAERLDPEHTGQMNVYCYKQVSGITWKDGTLSWEPVAGAIYKVYINGKMVKTLSQTSYDIEDSLKTGENTVSVDVSGVPCISSTGGKDYETNGTLKITKLAQVTNLSIGDQKLTWDAVEGATSYKVYCNGTLKTTVKTTSYEVYIDEDKVGSDSYTVQACGASGVVASDVSAAVTIGRLAAPTGLQLNDDIILWNQVQGASGYRIYEGNNLVCEVSAEKLSVNMLGRLEKGEYQLSVVAVGPNENMLSSGKSQILGYHVDKTIIYITSEEELKNIVLKLDATYVLGADITLTGTWTPLGTTATPFTGQFNGNGHSIIGLDITATSGQGTGMFGVVGKGAIIEELVIKDALCSGGNGYGSVAIVAGINRGTIRNVQVYGSVDAQNSDNVGGIIGRNYGSVYNCTNHASVNGKRYVGGIVGNCEISDFNLEIFGCSNYGEIQGTYQIGGVMGNVSVKKKTTIYKMHNEGNVTASDRYAGGIFGYISGESGQTGTLQSCSNTGDICANTFVAGCFGSTGAYVDVTVNNIADTSLNCTNTGKITAESNSKFDEIYVH